MKWRLWLFLLLFGLLAVPAQALKIKDLGVASYGDYLVLYAYLEDIPQTDLREALKHGLGLSFSYQIEIYRLRRFRRDQKLVSQEITRTVYYDPVKNVYFVQTVGAPGAPLRASSPQQALWMASSLEGLPLLPLSKLSPQHTYRLKIRAVVRKFSKTGWPKKIIKFLLFKGDTLESPWESLKFRL